MEAFSAAAGIAGLPLLIAALFFDIDGIWWFVGIWVAVEVILLLLRPKVIKRTERYRPPRGPVP
jgi:hypothetical protein